MRNARHRLMFDLRDAWFAGEVLPRSRRVLADCCVTVYLGVRHLFIASTLIERVSPLTTTGETVARVP